ncbi:MAG TPA: CoA transferase [Bradyrhizobium sp.]|nr:CoA transferase [Bradyrhizobium sp.]
MAGERERRELLINAIAGLLQGIRHVAVGASSPIPAAGAMLLRARNARDGKPPVNVTILGSNEHNFFTNGTVELFDCAAQGRVDAFFLGGGQIDGAGNINLVGTGQYPKTDVRWPGSFGSAYLYHLVPRVILFREEHSPRVFVPKVDFVSAAATTPEVKRRGGPYALLTNMALFDFDRVSGGFALRSVHPGFTPSDIRSQTGFDYAEPAQVPMTVLPDAATLSLLRGRIMDEVAEAYPAFARAMLQAA